MANEDGVDDQMEGGIEDIDQTKREKVLKYESVTLGCGPKSAEEVILGITRTHRQSDNCLLNNAPLPMRGHATLQRSVLCVSTCHASISSPKVPLIIDLHIPN